MSKVLIAIILSWFICQTIKIFLHIEHYHRVNFWVYLEDGGMPSAHSTVLIALCSALFYETGLSPLFLATTALTFAFLIDTMKVRRQQGIQAEFMAKFIDIREVLRRKLTEGLGHTPEQVFVGALLGFFITSLLYLI